MFLLEKKENKNDNKTQQAFYKMQARIQNHKFIPPTKRLKDD